MFYVTMTHIQTCNNAKAEVEEVDIWGPDAHDEACKGQERPNSADHTATKAVGHNAGYWTCRTHRIHQLNA